MYRRRPPGQQISCLRLVRGVDMDESLSWSTAFLSTVAMMAVPRTYLVSLAPTSSPSHLPRLPRTFLVSLAPCSPSHWHLPPLPRTLHLSPRLKSPPLPRTFLLSLAPFSLSLSLAPSFSPSHLSPSPSPSHLLSFASQPLLLSPGDAAARYLVACSLAVRVSLATSV